MRALYNDANQERKPLLCAALRTIAELDTRDGLVTKLTEVCDRATRCSSAKRQAFNLLISHAHRISQEHDKRLHRRANTSTATNTSATNDATANPLLTEHDRDANSEADLDTPAGALRRLAECIEDFLDDHKARAFASSTVQPLRMYFDAVDDDHNRDHVDVHGLNWFLALLHSGLGAQLPVVRRCRLTSA